MGPIKKGTLRQQGAKIQPLTPRGAGAKLLAIYSDLVDSDRRSVLDLLQEHAFLLRGTNSYLWWNEGNEIDRRTSYFRLLNTVSEQVATAWLEWAFEISVGHPSRARSKEAILYLIGELVRLKFLEEPLPVEWPPARHRSATRKLRYRT